MLAVPAVAVAAEPDPIFAAIERFDEAHAVELAGFDARANAGTLSKNGTGRSIQMPSPRKCTRYSGLLVSEGEFTTHEEIATLKNGSLAEYVPFFHCACLTSKQKTTRRTWRCSKKRPI